MGELKPLGSEKLNGDEKLKRILELTYYNQPKKTATNNKTEIVKESFKGGVYGIVKEKDGYYVKHGLNENSLDYIGGMFMKNKNRFSSYAESLKRMELISGQEKLQEATKYILKKKEPNQEAPLPEPTMDAPSPEMSGDMGGEMPSPEMSGDMGGEMPSPEMGGEMPSPEMGGQSKRSDYMAEVQKFAGKLGQELRDQHEKMESDDIKYVLNMIISAVNLDKLELDDLEEIGKKFERDEDNLPSDDEFPEEEPTAEPTPEPSPEMTGDEELGENISKLNSFIRSSAPSDAQEINLSKYADLGSGDVTEESEIDIDEIKNEINSRISETLSKYFK